MTLPQGKVLDVEARLLTFSALSEPDPRSAPPTGSDAHVYLASREAGRDHMMAAARYFGLDPAEVTSWYREATAPRPVAVHPT